MCYVCRRVFYFEGGYPGDPEPPTDFQASQVPCDFLVDVVNEVSEKRAEGSLLSDNWPLPTRFRS